MGDAGKLYIGQLDYNADERDLEDLFGKYGTVVKGNLHPFRFPVMAFSFYSRYFLLIV